MASPHLLGELRARIAALERRGAGGRVGGAAAVSLGPELDAALPGGGLARGALHEVLGAEPDGSCLGENAAAAAFCAVLLGRLAADGRPVLWCLNAAAQGRGGLAGVPYAPGFARFGIDPGRLVLARARRDVEALWVAEEALRTPDLAAVLAEVGALDLTESRRLQLAAEAGGATAILLRPGAVQSPTAAATRWRVTAQPGVPTAGPAAESWWIDLLRARGGRPQTWAMCWAGPEAGLTMRGEAAPERRPARAG